MHQPLDDIFAYLEQVLQDLEAPASFRKLLQSATCAQRLKAEGQVPFTILPWLCCQAVGGCADRGVMVAGTWWLLMLAARILDDVEDNDWNGPHRYHLDSSSREQASEVPPTPAQDLNFATSLIFASTLTLIRLASLAVRGELILDLISDFQSTALRVASGQHMDLSAGQNTSLGSHWNVAYLKAGEPFALGCRAGARVGGGNAGQVHRLGQFGYSLGMLNQIHDDISGIWNPSDISDLASGRLTLPILYALEVAPGTLRDRLQDLLTQARSDPQAQTEASETILQLGALHYMLLEAERFRQLAREALQNTGLPRSSLHTLFDLLDQASLFVSEGDGESQPLLAALPASALEASWA